MYKSKSTKGKNENNIIGPLASKSQLFDTDFSKSTLYQPYHSYGSPTHTTYIYWYYLFYLFSFLGKGIRETLNDFFQT